MFLQCTYKPQWLHLQEWAHSTHQVHFFRLFSDKCIFFGTLACCFSTFAICLRSQLMYSLYFTDSKGSDTCLQKGWTIEFIQNKSKTATPTHQLTSHVNDKKRQSINSYKRKASVRLCRLLFQSKPFRSSIVKMIFPWKPKIRRVCEYPLFDSTRCTKYTFTSSIVWSNHLAMVSKNKQRMLNGYLYVYSIAYVLE